MVCPMTDRGCQALDQLRAKVATVETDVTNAHEKIRHVCAEINSLRAADTRHEERISQTQEDLLELRQGLIDLRGDIGLMREIQTTQTDLLQETYRTGLSTLSLVQAHATDDAVRLHSLFGRLFIVLLLGAVAGAAILIATVAVVAPDRAELLFKALGISLGI